MSGTAMASRTTCRLFGLALILLADAVLAEQPPDDVLMRAMQDELERTMQQLHMEQTQPPYFVAYRIDETERATTAASFGALTQSGTFKNRTLAVEMRVGDHNLDNTNFLPVRSWREPVSRTRRRSLPLEDDYRELRRHIWLATDAAYKNALERLAKKRAALRNRSRDDIPDFSAETPHTWHQPEQATTMDVAAMEATVRDLARLFTDTPQLNDSRVGAIAAYRRTRYLNSEGSSFSQQQTRASVFAMALTQAPDGTVLQDFEAFNGRTWQQLPSMEAMTSAVRAMGSALSARRQADAAERYSGPILFQGQAAAELFAQAMLPRLLAVRVPVLEDERMGSFAASLRNPFEDKIGARILPRFLSLRDDPRARSNDAGALLGGYAVDGEGVPAGATPLVENGVLKTLLSARNPIAGITRSSGNRRGEWLLPSNLLVTTTRGLEEDELRAEFLKLVAERGSEYGIVVRRIANQTLILDPNDSAGFGGTEVQVERPTRAYRVYADGREAPIRKLELSGFSESDFRDIVAVSRTLTNYSLTPLLRSAYTLRATSALYGSIPRDSLVSISTPDLLFEELTVRKPLGDIPRPPVLTHPAFRTAVRD